MKVVVIGDVGWRDLYHLGDEAMTEAAIQMLAARGVDEITIIGGQADVTSAFYGLPSVARIGFRGNWDRKRHETTLAAVGSALAGESTADSALAGVIDAVQHSDAVLIAGGGNMNSDHVNHLYERLALTRVAKAHNVPLYVVSQTVGPYLIDRDREMVQEILEYARCFAAREADTYHLLKGLSADGADKVSHMMDDAMMLRPEAEDLNALSPMRLASRYIVGSFTAHSGTSGMSDEAYYSSIARTLDELAAKFDADIALVPHAGSLDRSIRKGDQLANDRIFAATTSGRVVNADMLTARQAIALTRGSVLSINTRYHPTVFSPAVGTPCIGIAISYYSSVRMRGAGDNLGLKGFALPTASWETGTVVRAASAILGTESEPLARHLDATITLRRGEQDAWWDDIVESMRSGMSLRARVLSPVPEFANATWTDGLDATILASDQLGQLRVASKHAEAQRRRATSELAELRTENDSLRAQIAKLSADLNASRNRFAARVANGAGRFIKR